MNRHYDRYLVKKYEPLYAGRHHDPRTTNMCFGFEVGDGWFNIINTLSSLLCNDWLIAKREYEHLLQEPTRVDELQRAKAALATSREACPLAIQVKEKYGTLRFYLAGATPEQYAYSNFAEYMSGVTCEVCGDRGQRNYFGWVQTRCRKHTN